MPKKKTAFVVVDKSWFNRTINPLITGEDSGSQGEAHVLMGPLDDEHDPHGLWLEGIESRFLRKADRSPAIMRLMIPWLYVLAFGVVDESFTLPVGFTGTVLTASSTGWPKKA